MQKFRSPFFLFSALFIMAISCNKKEDSNQLPPDDPNWPKENTRTVKSGLNFPWEILWGKDNHIWMTERNGKISKIDPLNGNTVFSYIIADVVSQGEGGLLGMVHHPDFMNNGLIFVVYNYTRNGAYTQKVVKLTYSNNAITNPVTIIDNIPAAGIHNGSRMVISNESS
ncbi:MAG: PQQ-dependent sugar dehydrogenase, partial [Chitinophagaceae bacterium]